MVKGLLGEVDAFFGQTYGEKTYRYEVRKLGGDIILVSSSLISKVVYRVPLTLVTYDNFLCGYIRRAPLTTVANVSGIYYLFTSNYLSSGVSAKVAIFY